MITLYTFTNYNMSKKHSPYWRDVGGGDAVVTRLHSDKISRYNMPATGLVVRYGDSSIIDKIRRDAKKAKNKAAHISEMEESRNKILKGTKSANVQELPFRPRDVQEFSGFGVDAAGVISRPKKLQGISRKQAANIKRNAAALFRAARRAGLWCGFITLTFIQEPDDKTGQRCLQSMMNNWLKREYGNASIWVAERQRTGRLHFHILIVRDKRVDIDEENKRWTRIQYNNGLCKRLANGDVLTKNEFEGYCTVFGVGTLVNSFDVKKVKDIEGVGYYITKYVAKGTYGNDAFEFKPYGISRTVSRLYKSALVIPELFDSALSADNTRKVTKQVINKDTGELKKDVGDDWEPLRFTNEYADTVTIVNQKFYESFFDDMDLVNANYLLTGNLAPPEYLSYTEVYNRFIFKYTQQEIDFANDNTPFTTPLGWLPGGGSMRINNDLALVAPFSTVRQYTEGDEYVTFKKVYNYDSYTRLNRHFDRLKCRGKPNIIYN